MPKSSPRSSLLRHGGSSSRGSMGLAKVGLMLIGSLPRLHSHPTVREYVGITEEGEDMESGDFWVYFSVAFVLVVLGGIFAGLTLGLMGQDEIYLQVIEQSGDINEKKNAAKVLRLLKRGKHWVLVTLLLSNVITNETLPIVLDRSLGGGWPAVLTSTILIVIFGEIIPQSICVRYGLGIGAALSPYVLGLMYLMYPVAYPTALLLDRILGEDHGTVYKKAGLKTLVTLHKTLGTSPSERLNEDEVTIISAVLDLKDKPVGNIMTPIKDVFIMSSDTILDEPMMDEILSAGYSRIPIHAPNEPSNFIGMLLVKVLITYDPEDAKPVGQFPLATLPETRPETSCLDIVNFFQEGKSHMAIVSTNPGENEGALGVVTLEDVIEELIGEEIVDESDVFIDVHKAIRRINPSPLALSNGARRSISANYIARNVDPSAIANTATGVANTLDETESASLIITATPSRPITPDMRYKQPAPGRRSASKSRASGLPDDVIAHLTLGPANLADRPRETKSKTIKIKTASDSHINFPATPAQHTKGLNRVDSSRVDSLRGAEPSPSQYGTADGAKDVSTDLPDREVYSGKKVTVKKARSGSLTERIDYIDGVPKTVIETTSDSDDADDDAEEEDEEQKTSGSSKNGKGHKKNQGSWGSSKSEEESPLLNWK